MKKYIVMEKNKYVDIGSFILTRLRKNLLGLLKKKDEYIFFLMLLKYLNTENEILLV